MHKKEDKKLIRDLMKMDIDVLLDYALEVHVSTDSKELIKVLCERLQNGWNEAE